jgi:GT2 family glycosyltransferase
MADTHSEDRVVTHYEAYFVDPEKELRRVLDSLGLTVSEVTLQKACSTISRKLRHNRFSKQDIFKAGGSPELLELYEDLCAESGPIFQTALAGKTFVSTQLEAPQPITSIIILTHNQLGYTKRCIESIFKQTKEPFELIVVDNGSTDSTNMYLEKLVHTYVTETDGSKQNTKPVTQHGKKKRKKKPKNAKLLNGTCRGVRLIKNDKNLGFAAGNNQGMAVAKGNYILLMNNDVVVTPGWLNRMISCVEQRPKIGIVGPMSNYVSGPQLVKEVSYDTTSLARLNKFAKEFAEKNTDQGKLIWRVVGFCMLIKRAVIDKIGGMDDRYGLGNFEDDDFSLRAALAGFESRIAEDCFVHHFGSRTFIGES